MISYVVYFFFRKIFVKETVFLKILYEFLSLSLTLTIIYFASKSFSFSSDVQNIETSSLFSFLLIGEVALVLPMSFAEKFLLHFSEIRNSHFYQTLLGLKISPYRVIIGKTLIDSIFPFLRIMLILLFSALILGFYFSVKSFVLFLLLQIFSTGIFLLMSFLTSMFILRFNKGLGFFFTVQSLAAVAGGAYFPTSAFPEYFKKLTTILPQTQILFLSRRIFHGENITLNALIILVGFTLLLALILFFCSRFFVASLRKKAKYF